MNRGYIRLWRKSKESAVFAHEGLWKLWCLCLMKANHEEAEVPIDGILKPIKLNPGQFITGRYSLHYDYHQGHIKKRYSRKAKPTPYSLIRWLLTLQQLQMLSIKTFNKYSIITILNWELYQENEHQVSIRRASSEHKQTQLNTNKTPEKILSDISEFRKRYSDPNLIYQVFDAIRCTRKSGKVKDSILLAQLERWERYPIEQVESGIKIYLEKNYAADGKDENYLYGIIRKAPKEPKATKKTSTFYQSKEITPENAEQLYAN